MITRFGELDDRKVGVLSHSGWNTGYILCDGTNHYERWLGAGIYVGRDSLKPTGPCDGSCAGGVEVEPTNLDNEVVRGLGIKVAVPDGAILVRTFGHNVQQGGYRHGFEIVLGGHEVHNAQMSNTLLRDGEEVTVRQTDGHGHNGEDVVIRNVGGEVQIDS